MIAFTASSFGDFAANAMVQFSMAVKGRYLALIAAGVKPTPAGIAEFLTFTRNVSSHTSESIQAALPKDPWQDMGRTASMVSTLNRLMMEFSAHYSQNLRLAALGELDLYSKQHGAMGMLAQQKAVDDMPKVLDDAGRKCSIEKLTRMIARDAVYQSFVDSVFRDAQNLAGSLVAFETTNDTGEVVQTLVDPFDESARKLFHVNSKKEPRIQIAQAQ